MKIKQGFTYRSFLWLYVASFLMFLAYAYLAFYTQPINDDFCFAFYVSESDSLLDNIKRDWMILNGRWGTSGLRYLFMTIIGIESAYWLTIPLSIIAIFSASLLLANVIAFASSKQEKFHLAIVNSVVFLSICSSLSDVVFWGTGLTDYTVGYFLVSLCIYCGFLVASSSQRPSVLIYALLLISIVLSCGLAEVFTIVVWAFLIFSFIFGKNKPYLVLPILFMAVATGFNILAPGNEVRSGNVTESLEVSQFIKEVVIYGLRGILLPFLGMYFISFLPGIKSLMNNLSNSVEKSISKRNRIFISLFVIGLPALIILILLISLGAPGPGRAHNISLFAIISVWPVLISVIPFLNPTKVKTSMLVVPFAILGVLVLVLQNNKDIAEDIFTNNAKNFHIEVSKIRQQLQLPESVQQQISLKGENRVPNISSATDYFVTADKNYWINRCVSLHYKLKSIEAIQPSK